VLSQESLSPDSTGLTLIDLAYYAGFLDGEGYFGWTETTCRVAVTNTYLDALIRLFLAFGGMIYKFKDKKPGYRQRYQWQIYADSAEAAANKLMPYLHEKRRQAQIMLRVRDYPKGSRQRTYLLNKLKELKHKEHA